MLSPQRHFSAQVAAAGPVKNIVLVHGYFADGSGWQAVSKILSRDGYKVSVVQAPETSFKDDVAATTLSPRPLRASVLEPYSTG